jgi:hypothetical protein
MRIVLLLVESLHLVSTIYDIRAIVSHEVFTLRERFWLLHFVNNFNRRYVSIVNRVNCKLNVILHQEIHESVLFLEW